MHGRDMSTATGLDGPVTTAPTATTWRDVLRGAATGQLLMAAFMGAVTLAFEHHVDPMPVVIGAVVGGGVLLLRTRPGRGAVVYTGIVSLLLFGMVASFGGLGVFSRPASTFELILFGGLLVVTALGFVAAVGAWRGAGGPTAATASKVASAVIAGIVGVGVGVGLVVGSAPRMPGDIALRAKGFEFDETTIEAEAGRVAVWVDNQDVASHDFTIKGIVQRSLPGQKAGRADFQVEAGTYRFYCSFHPDMEGTLRVS